MSAAMIVFAAALALVQPATLAKDNASLPRIAAPDAAGARINAALTKVDANWRAFQKDCRTQGPTDQSSTNRSVEVAMAGPGFLSLVVHYGYDCGGAYPDTGAVALVYDLVTGRPVNWQKLLPARLAKTASLDSAGDGTMIGQIASPDLHALYRKVAGPGEDKDCAEVLADPDLTFQLWPDAKAGGVALEPASLPHVVKACAATAVIPTASLRKLGADKGLLDAVDAAHAGRGR
jgi:hypothetical protein